MYIWVVRLLYQTTGAVCVYLGSQDAPPNHGSCMCLSG